MKSENLAIRSTMCSIKHVTKSMKIRRARALTGNFHTHGVPECMQQTILATERYIEVPNAPKRKRDCRNIGERCGQDSIEREINANQIIACLIMPFKVEMTSEKRNNRIGKRR